LLRLDERTNFDIYLEKECGMGTVLYRHAELPFTEEARRRLHDNDVNRLWVREDQGEAFREYVNSHLGAIAADRNVPPAEKARFLYTAAQDVVHALIQEARLDEALPRSEEVAVTVAHFLYSEDHAFHHMLGVASQDYYTYTHSVNVFVFSVALAERLGYSEAEVRAFAHGALVHDLGKSKVSRDIINCKGKLSQDQWVLMKQHPRYGYEILRERGCRDPIVLDVTLHHHEKLNGSGYPDGLRGGEISPWVRICTVADIFDALTTRRSYKEAVPSFPGLKLMQEEMMEEIDPDVFSVFVQLMADSQRALAPAR
jgi:putative nucleotidyltransferase with HDIG domain